MAEEYPTKYAKRLTEFEKKKTKAESSMTSLDKDISQIEAVLKNNQKELAVKKKERENLETIATKELSQEQKELRKSALSSVPNLFMYKAFCLNNGKAEELYNSLVSKYQMLKDFLKPNSWLVIEENGVDQKKSSNQRTALNNEIDYGYIAIGKTMDRPIAITKRLEEDGEVYMQIRLRFQEEGFVFRTYGAKSDGSGMGIRIDLVEKPDRPEFGKSEDSIYWHLFAPILFRLEENEKGISYEPASLTDPTKLDFYHGDSKLKKMGLDPSVKSVKELYNQIKK